MNFFEAQARARRRTGWLLLLFGLAVAVLVVLVNLLVMVVVSFFHQDARVLQPGDDWGRFALVALGTVAFIAAGSLYKMLALSGGGRAVAEMLGGRLVPRNTDDPAQRRLINVVDEMAIAAGTPAPPVYLLDEMGINAFAAGLSPNDAVIGVTRGAITYLSRDELQGVMAHEFSHIFNGDMRLNIRLVGVLHGILLIGLTGYHLLRATRFARGSRGKGGNVVLGMLVLGLGLLVIGYAGFFFGQWIKAIVSRQREFLADASAVQFTRNRDGIANALKKIGGSTLGSVLHGPAAAQYSHACFSDAVGDWMESLFATHPPLRVRIKRIDSRWDGRFVPPAIQEVAQPRAKADIADARRQVLVGAVVAGVLTPDDALALIGQAGPGQVGQAQDILAAIPEALRQASAEPYGARAVVCALLLGRSPEHRAEQTTQLAKLADPAVSRLAVQMQADVQRLPEAGRLPLADLCLPTLRSLSRAQYESFRQAVLALIAIDRKIDMDEWLLRHFLMRQLDQHFGLRPPPRPSHGLLGSVNREASLLVSLAAHLEHADAAAAEQAFTAGIKAVGATALKFVPRDHLKLEELDGAVDRLAELKPLLKPRVLKACAACLMFDNRVTVKGQELLRTIASCLDSPMPPLAAGRLVQD